MPSLHSAGWQRRHLDWEFKLQNKQSETEAEPDRTLVDGMINATESFLRSSEVHRLFIQELTNTELLELSQQISKHLLGIAKHHADEVIAAR